MLYNININNGRQNIASFISPKNCEGPVSGTFNTLCAGIVGILFGGFAVDGRHLESKQKDTRLR